jgi:hypothetical protein
MMQVDPFEDENGEEAKEGNQNRERTFDSDINGIAPADQERDLIVKPLLTP